MIIISYDPLSLKSDVMLFNVTTASDYVPAYAKIKEAISRREGLEVVVREKSIFIWFKRMAEHYEHPTFSFCEFTARDVIQERCGVVIPEHISDEEIISAGLLELDIVPKEGVSLDNVVLEYFYGQVFTSPVFPINRMVEILQSFEPERWSANAHNQLANKIYLQRLNVWKQKAKDLSQEKVIELIEEDLFSLSVDLMKYKILRNYKNIGWKLLDEKFQLFSSLNFNLRDLIVEEDKVTDVIDHVEYYLNDLPMPKDNDEFLNILENISGLLLIEYERLNDIFKKNPDLITKEIIQHVSSKFIQIKDRISPSLSLLEKQIKPPKPSTPPLKNGVEDVLNWVVNEYIPYFRWLDYNKIADMELIEKGDQFARWLYGNWEKIRASSNRMVFNIIPNNIDRFKAKKRVDLVVIIDNLGLFLLPLLYQAFQQKGFFLKESKMYLSMLPSETEISKKCLLSGVPTYQDIEERGYTKIIEKGWEDIFKEKGFVYLSDIEKLKGLREVKANAYFVNYRSIDKALHLSESELGIPHEKHIEHLLASLVEEIDSFIKNFNLSKMISIHICSDHGSTRIPKSLTSNIDKEFFKANGFKDPSHRFIVVSPERFSKLPDNLKTDCFFLDASVFGNKDHYLCARRANRFIDPGATCYLHGGLSPEEVVVPYLIFEKTVLSNLELTVLLIKKKYRYQSKEIIELELGNPNQIPAKNISIDVLNTNVEASQYQLGLLDCKRNEIIKLPVRFNKTTNKEESQNLHLGISFMMGGKEMKFKAVLPIEMVSMFETKGFIDFDDMI